MTKDRGYSIAFKLFSQSPTAEKRQLLVVATHTLGCELCQKEIPPESWSCETQLL